VPKIVDAGEWFDTGFQQGGNPHPPPEVGPPDATPTFGGEDQSIRADGECRKVRGESIRDGLGKLDRPTTSLGLGRANRHLPLYLGRRLADADLTPKVFRSPTVSAIASPIRRPHNPIRRTRAGTSSRFTTIPRNGKRLGTGRGCEAAWTLPPNPARGTAEGRDIGDSREVTIRLPPAVLAAIETEAPGTVEDEVRLLTLHGLVIRRAWRKGQA
jgi:hypothetical protein